MNAASEAENGIGRWRREGNMNLGEISVGTSKLVQLRLLTDPENSQGHAHKKNEQAWRRRDENAPEITLGMSSTLAGTRRLSTSNVIPNAKSRR
jgi:hypothetical protein